MRKTKSKLSAKWSKRDNDVLYCWPAGSQTKADAGFLSVLLRELLDGLEERGYDRTTVKFEIAAKDNDERFGE